MVEDLHLIPGSGLLLKTTVHRTSFALLAFERDKFITVQLDDERERRAERLPVTIDTIDKRQGAGIIGHDVLVGHLIIITTVVIIAT